ncbi:MAG: FAD-dependent oxidoreductase [Alkalispirochaeta sp.]
MEHGYDVTIVGAGIAGLAAARELSGGGLRTLILDKGRQVGGRMATRRLQGGAFDTGAQFFTAVSPKFRTMVEAASEAGAVVRWYQRPPRQTGAKSFPVWRGSESMTDLPKWIASGLRRAEPRLGTGTGTDLGTVELRKATRVARVEPAAEGVLIFTDENTGIPIRTRSVILTPPAPQALALLPQSITDQVDPAISKLQYDPCLALLISLDIPLPELFNEHGYFRPTGGDGTIAWVADNTRKGLPGTEGRDTPRLTIHSSSEAARRLYDEDTPHAMTALTEALAALLPGRDREAPVRALAGGAGDLKKWRYARPTQRWSELSVPVTPSIIIAGDGFGGARVEGAFASGIHAAGRILQRRGV